MDKIKRPQLIVRQHSKVEKIPDEESEELLKKSEEITENGTPEQNVENMSHKTHISNKNVSLVRALSRTSENDENAAEVTVKGNLHIYMPGTDETCGGAITYRNQEGDETSIDIDIAQEKLKSTKRKGILNCIRTKCSRQKVVNIVFGILIAIALVIGTKALHAKSANSHGQNYLYCYTCQSIDNKITLIKHINNMCCTYDPIEPISKPKVSKH